MVKYHNDVYYYKIGLIEFISKSPLIILGRGFKINFFLPLRDNSKDNAIWRVLITLMGKTLNLKEFKIVEHANSIAETIWEEVVQWKYFEKDTIGKELVRAADSISANLSEAYGRYSFADRKRFAYYARGSLCETINWIQISARRGLIDRDKGQGLQAELNSLSLRINIYIKHLKAQ